MHIDAVIILANEMDHLGNLNQESSLRAKKGVEVFRTLGAKKIITCGWAYRNDSKICIADAFKEHLIAECHVEDNDIITECNSRDTVGDAFFSKVNIIQPFKWKNIAIVTSDYHLERSIEIFQFIYGKGTSVIGHGVETSLPNEKKDTESDSLISFRSTFNGVPAGNDDLILQRLRERHPFYNGHVYPSI